MINELIAQGLSAAVLGLGVWLIVRHYARQIRADADERLRRAEEAAERDLREAAESLARTEARIAESRKLPPDLEPYADEIAALMAEPDPEADEEDKAGVGPAAAE